MQNITYLTSLEWYIGHSTGSEYSGGSERDVLTIFHNKHLSARLNVLYLYRGATPIDCALLSSPHLHTLGITVYHYGSATFGYCELQTLKRCLATGNSIKSLHISFTVLSPANLPKFDPRRTFKEWETVSEGLYNFHWQINDRFPALEELSFDWGNYQFDPEDCHMWARAMDWNRLRKLDLAKGTPRHLLQALKDRVPNLKWLKCGISTPSPHHSRWDILPLETGLTTLANFLASVIALRELHFYAHHAAHFMPALQVLLKCQGIHLTKLDIACTDCSMKRWKINQYLQILEQAPDLEHFKAQIFDGKLEGTWTGNELRWGATVKFNSAVKNDKVIEEAKPISDSRRVARLQAWAHRTGLN